MKRVFFIKSFTGGVAPTAENELAIFKPATNTYVDFGEAAAASTHDELILQTCRTRADATLAVVSIPIYPKVMAVSDGTITAAAAHVSTMLLAGTPVVGNVYGLRIAKRGEGLSNRYVKTVWFTCATATAASVATGLYTAINTMGGVAAGSANKMIPGVSFVVADDSSALLTFTIQSGYEDASLDVTVVGPETEITGTFTADGSGASTAIAGMSATAIQKLEADCDTELGDRKFNYRSSDFFSFVSAYDVLCTDLVTINTIKQDDDPLPRETNLLQELLLFYDASVVINTTADPDETLSDLMDWITGASTTITADS